MYSYIHTDNIFLFNVVTSFRTSSAFIIRRFKQIKFLSSNGKEQYKLIMEIIETS